MVAPSIRTGGVLAVVCVAGAALGLAQPAQAYGTGTMKVSCSAVNVRSGPSQGNVIVGVGYRGDTVRVTQFVYKVSERRWYSHGTVTRRSDGRKVSGYGIYDCINPYNASPPPAYPKRP
jgi:hypothetical protein